MEKNDHPCEVARNSMNNFDINIYISSSNKIQGEGRMSQSYDICFYLKKTTYILQCAFLQNKESSYVTCSHKVVNRMSGLFRSEKVNNEEQCMFKCGDKQENKWA